jgi:diaminopimelate epimerase
MEACVDLKVTKMHGLGNDFIILDNREGQIDDYSKIAKILCRRRFHIGADGILIIENSDKADLKMVIFNSDGSEAEMCGNGIRCFARYVFERQIINKTEMTIETKAGIMAPSIIVDEQNHENLLIRVNMGKPELRRSRIPMTGTDSSMVIDEPVTAMGETFEFTAVSMGNPHVVTFIDELPGPRLAEIGPVIEKNSIFPVKTNVEFARVENPEHVIVQVWERGAGETLACGTGACATVVAGQLKKVLGKEVRVSLPGGDLFIEWDGQGPVYMTGPAEEVFTGETKINPGNV